MGCSTMFQASMKLRIPREITPARHRGTRMPKRIRRFPAPSSLAASRMSLGQVSKTCRSRNTPKGENIAGRISAQ